MNSFQIGHRYYGAFSELNWSWRQSHSETDIRTPNKKEDLVETIDSLHDECTFVGKVSGIRCSCCNRMIETEGYQFHNAEWNLTLTYGKDCVKAQVEMEVE